MIRSKFKKALLKIKKRTIQALLYISEDKFHSAKSPFFTCFKIVIFFLQLEGYVYSQYESKPLNQPENIYLSNYTQLSPVTFFLLQIGDDILTQFFFYFIFCLHVTVYLTMMRMSLDSDIAKPNFIKKALNLFFINYQWMFVTPFQEISVGVMVCGKTAFIQENKDSPTCTNDKSKLFYIFGVLGTLFVTLSGFSISYFFRNYEFYDKTFSRQYSYSNLIRIIMHQFVIIFYYINFPGIDYAKHFLQQILGLTLIADILINQPFGYSFESNFYCAATFTHQYFLVLTSVWIFSPGINDSFFFFTLLLITPLLIILSGQLQKRDQIRIVNTFQLTQFNDKADKYLEEIYRTADESDTNIESKILFIQVMNHHVKNCSFTECPCKKDVQGFFNNNSINYQKLNDWSTMVFEKCLKLSLIYNDYTFYEHMALKYVTFLAKYKNNPINAYSILQSIMNNQESQNVLIKGKQVQKSSFYFFNIQAILQKRNRNNFSTQGLHHSQQLQLLLKGQSIIENIGNDVAFQIRILSQLKQKFWEDYSNSRIQTFQALVNELSKVQEQISFTQTLMTILRNKTEQRLQFDCISILNLELLFSICFTNNILETYKIQKQIQQTLLLEQQELDSYLNFHFQNQLAISIISNITQQSRGEIWKPNQTQLEKYFKMSCSITNINQLMPPFIADIHDYVIENLIKRGKSNLLEQTNLVFSNYGENLIQPLILTLGYFFPKFEKDFQFYLIAFFKKVEDNYKIGSQEINSTGYIYFDIHLNVLGISEVIAEKLSNIFKKDIDLNKIELCYLLPVVVESFIFQYKYMIEKEISNFSESDLLIQKQQESFYIPDEIGKVFQINLNCSIKQRLAELEDIYDDLQKTNPFPQFQQYQIQFFLFSKNISYQKGGTAAVRELFLVKLQFLDEQDNQQDNPKPVENQVEQNHTPNLTSEQSPTIEDGVVELVSQRSKSSSQTILQQSNQFHSQLLNNQKNQIIILFFLLNIFFAGFFLAIFMSISFTILNKYDLSSNCVTIQNQVNAETASYASIVIALSNEKLSSLLTLPSIQLNFNQIEQTINPYDNLQIQHYLVDYTIKEFTTIVQQQTLQINFPEMIQLERVDEIESVRSTQNLSDLLIYRQVILTSAQNEQANRNLQDLSIVVINYPTQIMLLNDFVLSCFSDFNNILTESTNNSTQILIFIYAILFLVFIAQLVIVNRFIRKRKLILKLFTRIDFKEAVLEAEKFKLISTHLRNCENFWLSSKISKLIQQINQKSGKDDYEFGQKQSDRAKTVTKSDKIDNTENTRSKIQISHQISNVGSLLILTGITLFTFIYIISFHVQIVQSSNSISDYFNFRQVLQQFQYNYHTSFSNCYYQMLHLAFTHIQGGELLPLIYLQNETMNLKLQSDIEVLNSNNFSRILIESNNSNIMNLLSLDESQQEQFYQGYFCELDEAICSLSNERDIQFSSQLYQYYNQSIQQLLLQQGQIFAQNNHFYEYTNNQTIYTEIVDIITSQNYFLNNLWGFDLIITRISNSIIFLINRMMDNLQQGGQKMFLSALIIGIFYFILTISLLMIFSNYQKKQNLMIRFYLIHVPFATIVKKNIHQQLKFID